MRAFGNSKKLWLISAIFALVLCGAVWESRRVNSADGAPPAGAVDAALRAPAPVVAILNRSCIDCHSERTRWPWYAHIPPASWLIGRDVNHARSAMNLSRLGNGPGGSAAAVGVLSVVCKMIQSQHMPPLRYRLLHPNSGLNAGDKQALCGWATEQSAQLRRNAEENAAGRQ